uniref:Uncharacterized protein n=1 Tax=Timema shepardi TaxID=629360 RepID=A0A7R9AP18_TIMSH|nr:unnamed protein product [Timema shepardi]
MQYYYSLSKSYQWYSLLIINMALTFHISSLVCFSNQLTRLVVVPRSSTRSINKQPFEPRLKDSREAKTEEDLREVKTGKESRLYQLTALVFKMNQYLVGVHVVFETFSYLEDVYYQTGPHTYVLLHLNYTQQVLTSNAFL